jgi:membrane fusion protein (multidrug efflux system)
MSDQQPDAANAKTDNHSAKPDGKNDDKSEDKSDSESDGKKDDEPDGKKTSPEKKRKIRIILIVVGIVVLLAGGAFLAYHELYGRYFQETDDAYLQADAVTVSPKISGYVAQVLVNDNQDVAAGQALVRLDARDYRAQAEQYQAQIDISRANADTVRAQISEQRSSVDESRAKLREMEDTAAFTANEVRRYTPLVAIGAETKETLATRRNQADQAARQVSGQRAALTNAIKHINTLEAQVVQAEAQAGTARAQLKAANVNVESTTLIASVAGRIGDKTVRIGQFVQAGARLMSVVPLQSLYVSGNFKETQIGRMRPGQPVEIKIDALPGTKLQGRVESISPGTGSQFSLLPPQNATGNFTKIVQRVPVRIAVDASAETRRVLLPGLSLKVEVDTRDNKDAIKEIKKNEKERSEARE